MAKKDKQLTIGYDPVLFSASEVQKFVDEGYTTVAVDLSHVDMLFSPKVWRMNERLKPLMKMAFTALKNEKVRRGKKTKEEIDLGSDQNE